VNNFHLLDVENAWIQCSACPLYFPGKLSTSQSGTGVKILNIFAKPVVKNGVFYSKTKVN
jgi:hypothetical protein